jgi:hypothetical protein
LSTRGRDAATPATAHRTDYRQRLPRARLETPWSTTTPPPSRSPLFKHRARHDAMTGARFARTTVNSPALYATPSHVAKECGMPVNRPLLGLQKGGDPPPRRRRDTGQRIVITYTLSVLLTILALASITSLGTRRPRLLSRLACSRPSTGTPVRSNTVPRAHPCWTYGPRRNQDKPRCP